MLPTLALLVVTGALVGGAVYGYVSECWRLLRGSSC